MTDLRIDPATRDFVLTDGRFEVDDDVTTQVYLCLETRRGTRIGDLEFGSRLHELQSERSPEAAAARAPALVEEALRPLVDEGIVAEISTVAEARADGVALYITLQGPGFPPATFEVWQEVGP